MDHTDFSRYERGNGHGPRRENGNSEEKRPFTQTDPDTAAKIRIKEPPSFKRSGCFISRCVGACLIFGVLLLLALVAVIVYVFLFFRPPCTANGFEPGIGALNHGTVSSSTVVTESEPTIQPNLPWSGIRLPRTLIPSEYFLELRVDLEEFIFSGSVEIDVFCQKSTSFIVLHSNRLDIDSSKVSVMDIKTAALLELKRQFSVTANQFYVIELSSDLQAGRRYKLRFRYFLGQLEDNLRGLYRSSYKDARGRTRSVPSSYKVVRGRTRSVS